MPDMLDVLGVLLVALSVPENDHVLAPLFLQHSIDECVREVAPKVVRSDVRKEDVGVNRKREPETIAFPRDGPQVEAWHPQSPQVLARGRIELHHTHLSVAGGGLGLHLHARYGHCLAVGVPLQPCATELGVNQHRLVVRVAPHDLHTAILEANAEGRDLVVRPGVFVVPVDARDGHSALSAIVQAIDGHPVGVDTLIVVHVDLTVERAEENVLAIWGPFHECELCLDLLAPEPLTINGADDDSTILVDDADLLAVRTPLHVANDTAVTVVDHLLEPDAPMQHPDDDEAILIAGCQLSEILVPSDHHDVALVPLERLVHGQIALRTSSGFRSTLRRRLEFQDLQETALPATCNPPLRGVP
mmetsp:Transcript_49748/g.113225  ORF Transcript_49748/g.113225 Transcript_49748/m.113225 type:complete len:360 (+) Transcript_49748:237-1316(+)